MTAPTKAYLQFLQPTKNGPGGSTSVNGQNRLTFAFNPKEYSVSKSAQWQRSPAKGAKSTTMPEFVGSGERSMSLEVFLDATDPELKCDVKTAVETLFACLMPLPSTVDQQKPLPPFVKFCWGTEVAFTAYLKQVQAKYTLFKSDGTPLRASCQISLDEIPVESARQNPTSGGTGPVRGHTVLAGDSLASVAYGAYGDPTRWRDVADANGIDNPLRMRPGAHLLLPTG